MKSVFVCYKYTGIPVIEIHKLIDPIVRELEKKYIVYCSLYNDYNNKKYTSKQIMYDVLANIDKSDYFIMIADTCFGKSMVIEFGYAFKKSIPKLLIINKELNGGIIEDLSEYIIEYSKKDNIPNIINKYNLFLYYDIRNNMIRFIKYISVSSAIILVTYIIVYFTLI